MDGSQGDGPEADSFYSFSFDFADRMDIELDRDDDAETESHCVEEEEFLFGGDEERGSSTESSIMQNLNQVQSDSTAEEEATNGAIDQDVESVKQSNEESDDSDSAMGDVGVHPLLFPDVIRDVMNFLPATDIENCRLVCRTWNNEACTVLRNKRIVVFIDPDAVRVYNNAMRDTGDFPHSQFEFCISDFTGLVDENLREFWRIFGPHIKSLCFRQAAVYWRDLLDVIEQHVPNLEKLSFRHLPRTDVSRRNSQNQEQRQIRTVKEVRLASIPGSQTAAQERLTFLLRTLPNLETLEVLPMRAVVKTRVSMVLVEALQKPEVSLPNFKRINFNLELTSNGLDALASKRFPFQRLHLTLSNGAKANAFKELLTSLAPTLREFRVTFPDTFSNSQTFSARNSIKPEECVEVLRNLRILNMENFKGSINFVQKMPMLETLELTTPKLAHCVPFGFKSLNRGFGYSRGGFPADDHQLKYLKIFPNSSGGTAIAETLTLESISRCFPALNSIHLEGVDDDGLGVIYRNLPFLSEVELIKAKCTDQGLTGIPLEICNDMIETSTYIVVQAEKYRRDLFIGSLQFLRKLSISATDITDATIALGIADCKNLKELKIGSPKITDTGVIFVTDKFYKQLELLDLSECLEITEQSKFYAGEKLIGKLQVADTVPEDMQTAQTKPIRKEKAPNPNRGIIKLKRAAAATAASSSMPLGTGSAALLEMQPQGILPPLPPAAATASALVAQHSKFSVEDLEFFEEHSEDELRGAFAGPPFPVVDRNRRIFRIREAFRRNADFMRNLQRMGVQQFRRLYRREWEDRERFLVLRHDEGENNPRFVERRNVGFEFDEELDLMFLHHHRLHHGGGGANAVILDREDGVAENNNRDDMINELDIDSSDDEDDPDNINRQIVIAEDDGGPLPPPIIAPAAGDRDAGVGGGGDADQPNRLPEIHFAELFRLGLRPDDVEYWLHNRPLFEREENADAAGHIQNLPAAFRAFQVDAIRNMNIGDALDGERNAPPPPVDLQRDEDIDLEAIRRVVMNAFGDGDDIPELPLEG